MSATTNSHTKSILIFAGIALGVFAAGSLFMQSSNELKDSKPQPVAINSAKTVEDAELQRKRVADEQMMARKDQALAAEAIASLEVARERQVQRKRVELLKMQQENEKAALAKKEAHKVELAILANRDKGLRAKCASRTFDPRPMQVILEGGTLEVSYPYDTLYMLTRPIASEESLDTENFWRGTHLYFRGGSSLYLSVSYTVNGARTLGTGDWYKVSGKPYKLSVTTSDERVLKARSVHTLEPVAPGDATITVSLAGASVKIPILVVPLNIERGESADSLIERIGLPDDDLHVIATWPNLESVHNLCYDDDLTGISRSSAHHWKFNRFPGAVVAVDGKKVVNVSSTNPEYVWPKDQQRGFRDQLRSR